MHVEINLYSKTFTIHQMDLNDLERVRDLIKTVCADLSGWKIVSKTHLPQFVESVGWTGLDPYPITTFATSNELLNDKY